MHRVRRAAVLLLVFAIVAGTAGAVWIRARLHGSLPRLGVPSIRATTREDVARATGFVHAQDRFFQMDLARRRAAGELSALVGRRALPADREIRVHRFRPEALRALALMAARDRALIEAYTAGVNAGLRGLAAPPFEYTLLRQAPEPWRPEDSLLVILSMFVTLQDRKGAYESTVGTLHDVLPAEAAAFFAPRGTEWDTPVAGTALPMAPIPEPGVFDPRARRTGKRPVAPVRVPEVVRADPAGEWLLAPDGEPAVGSNSFAVDRRHTADGRALVANDMHLEVRVPNTWYRAVFEWPDPGGADAPNLVAGVTLPGVPAMIVGSNTYVAWGFTNTYGDWTDLILLDVDPADPRRYRTPGGWRTFERYDEVIHVAGDADVHAPVDWTIWGPVITPDHAGRPRALRWVAHAADRLASTVTPLEAARTLEQGFDAVNGLGTPAQNIVMADRAGRIGWSVFGSIPRREGFDGSRPQSWADGRAGWNGWLGPAEFPRIVDPAGGRIWTANQGVVDGHDLALLGDGSYEVGSRARQIRDALLAREPTS
jgi:penicillin amidase